MRLQIITDTVLQTRFSHFELGEMAFRAGVPAVQYRHKGFQRERDLPDLQRLVDLARELGRIVIVNDSVDLAAEVGAQAVHLGREDGSIAEARKRLGPDVTIGATVHTLQELEDLRGLPVDYIGVGPIFGTKSKDTGRPNLGLDDLEDICDQSPFPVVGIGGIYAGNAPLVRAAGAAGIAVLGAFTLTDDPLAAAEELLESVEGWPKW